jgi:hypothetical protein
VRVTQQNKLAVAMLRRRRRVEGALARSFADNYGVR